ncbi:MAG: ATP synthase subunit I [Acidobacteriaceae bacterium]
MIEQILTACALFAGVLIGILFFGGLWWTVQKVTSSRQPGLLFAASFLLRTVLTLAAFYLIGSGSWQRLLVCLIGFVLGRMLVKRLSQAPLNTDRGLLKEGVR